MPSQHYYNNLLRQHFNSELEPLKTKGVIYAYEVSPVNLLDIVKVRIYQRAALDFPNIRLTMIEMFPSVYGTHAAVILDVWICNIQVTHLSANWLSGRMHQFANMAHLQAIKEQQEHNVTQEWWGRFGVYLGNQIYEQRKVNEAWGTALQKASG